MDTEKKLRKGLLLGILVGIAWGLDGVLMGRLGLNSIFTDSAYAFSKGISEKSFLYSPLVTAFFHESFCFLWVAVVLLYHKQLKQVFKLLFTTKKGKATAIAALVGSPIGMSAYLLAIKYATAPYASSISVVYPGVGAILSYLILKERLSLRAVTGIAISLTGSFMLGFRPTGDIPDTFLKGILFAVIAVFGWASEGVIIGFVMKYSKGEDHVEATPQQCLCLRYFISMIAYALVVLPAIQGYPMAKEIVRSLACRIFGLKMGRMSRVNTAEIVFASELHMVMVLANMDANTRPTMPTGRKVLVKVAYRLASAVA